LLVYVELIQAVLALDKKYFDKMRTWFKISFLALTKLNIYKQTFKMSVTAAAVQAVGRATVTIEQ
jgi:hypothetical protein